MARFTVYHSDVSDQLGGLQRERELLSEIDADLRVIEPGKSPQELAPLLGDADAILADASPCAVASGLGPEEARAVIQKSFVVLAS